MLLNPDEYITSICRFYNRDIKRAAAITSSKSLITEYGIIRRNRRMEIPCLYMDAERHQKNISNGYM